MTLNEILFYLLIVQFIIISHEAGHAIVGRYFGIKHIHLVSGMGRILFKSKSFELRMFPMGGRCRFDEESHDALSRIQKIMIAIAGPAVNMVTAYVLFTLNAPELHWKLALVLGIINLLPVPRSDGWQIMTQILNKPHLSTLAINPWIAEGVIITVGLFIFLN